MNAATLGMAGFAAALVMAMAMPPLDELEAEQATATALVDAQAQAQHQADYQRWARRHCRNEAAVWMQLEHGVLVCYDGAGQRLDAAVVARTEVQP